MKYKFYRTLEKVRTITLTICWTLIIASMVLVFINAFDGLLAMLIMAGVAVSVLAVCEIGLFYMNRPIVVDVVEVEEA